MFPADRHMDSIARDLVQQEPATGSFCPGAQDSCDVSTHHGFLPQVPASPSATLLPPEFEEIALIGHGGQSLVYKARHRPTGDIVALKILRDGLLAVPEQQARLRREAETLRSLAHPQIVAIRHIGVHQGQPFLSLDYIPGGSLEATRRLWPLTPSVSARIVQSLAETMHFVHERRIVHRDLKPGNILLALPLDSLQDSSEGNLESDAVSQSTIRWGNVQPLISDFGLAKSDEDETSLTHSGAIMGTTGYLAPEQAEGRGKFATSATDIYALGAILYDLLTGQPPFRGTFLEVLDQVKHRSPPPMPVQVPPGLRRICLRCLEKDPKNRYSSAAILAQELNAWRLTAAAPPQQSHEPGLLRRWTGMSGPVSKVLFSKDGMSLWAASRDGGQIALWHVESGELLRTRPGPHSGTTGMAVSPDERWMLICTENGGLYLSDLHSEATAHRFDQLPSGVTCVATSPDSLWALSGDREGVVRLWDIAARLPLLRLRSHHAAVRCLTFTPDGSWIVSSGEDAVLRVSCARTGMWKRMPGTPMTARLPDAVDHLQFSADGNRMATCDSAGLVSIWEFESGALLGSFTSSTGAIVDLMFTNDGQSLLTMSEKGALESWTLETLARRELLGESLGRLTCMAGVDDGTRLALGSASGEILAWRLRA